MFFLKTNRNLPFNQRSPVVALDPCIQQNFWRLTRVIQIAVSFVVMFRPGPGMATKPWLWLSRDSGQAKAPTHGLALAQLDPSRGFWCTRSYY